jgi:hypothetical protein
MFLLSILKAYTFFWFINDVLGVYHGSEIFLNGLDCTVCVPNVKPETRQIYL